MTTTVTATQAVKEPGEAVPELAEKPEELTCLQFPEDVLAALNNARQYNATTLLDVFGPILQESDEQLLVKCVTPEQCQLRMTAFILKRQYQLRETASENLEVKQLIVGVAQECDPIQYRGRRS